MWDRIADGARVLIRSAEISIDAATPETYALNRRGGCFHRLLQNLEFISQLRRSHVLDYIKISMVVQENNFHEMAKCVTLGEGLGADAVLFSQLVDWGTMAAHELVRRQVHFPEHPRHAEFVEQLRDAALRHPIVDLGNLARLVPKN